MTQQRQRRFSTCSALLASNAVWTTGGHTTNTTTTNNNNNNIHHHTFRIPGHNSTAFLHHNLAATATLALPGVIPKPLSRQSEPLLYPPGTLSPPATTLAVTALPANGNAVAGASTTTSTSTSTSTSTLEAKKRRSSRDLQVVKTLVCLVLLFFTMWAPIFVVFLLIMRDALYHLTQVSSQAFLGAMCVAYLNAVLNPLAYGLSTERLRVCLRALLTCSGRLRRSTSPARASNGAGAGSVGGGGGGGSVRVVLRNGGGRAAAKSSGGTSVS